MKYLLLLLLFISCSKEPIANYTPKEITFAGSDLVFLNKLNEIRMNNNAPALKGEVLLTKGCINHSKNMFDTDSLNHLFFTNRYLLSKADKFGEVVAYGYNNPLSILNAYKNSKSHYLVLINPIYTHVGIASNGLYQTVDLASYK